MLPIIVLCCVKLGSDDCQLFFVWLDDAALFAQLIARTAKDIDVLIDSLPSEDSSPELQVQTDLKLGNFLLSLSLYIRNVVCLSVLFHCDDASFYLERQHSICFDYSKF